MRVHSLERVEVGDLYMVVRPLTRVGDTFHWHLRATSQVTDLGVEPGVGPVSRAVETQTWMERVFHGYYTQITHLQAGHYCVTVGLSSVKRKSDPLASPAREEPSVLFPGQLLALRMPRPLSP